jgi:hypothetical protein
VFLVPALTVPAPAYAAFTAPHRVSPRSESVVALDQATDRQGDTTFFYAGSDGFDIRVRKADGTLRPPVQVVDRTRVALSSLHAVAVDRDGDGIAVWDEEDDLLPHARLFARRFSRTGHLGPVVRISQHTPVDQSVIAVHAAVQPGGRAVITWNLQAGAGYRPYLRLVGLGSGRSHIKQVGPGPNADAPLVLMKPTGGALLLWNNDAIMARHLGARGHLFPIHRLRGERYPGEQPTVEEAAFDRHGVAVIGAHRAARITGPAGTDYRGQACIARVSPRLHLIGKLRAVSPHRRDIAAGTVRIGVAPGGQAIVSWLYDHPFDAADGTYARSLSPSGSLGRPRRLSYGDGGEIALTRDGDGVVTSTGVPRDQFGTPVKIFVTRVHNGRLGRTLKVAHGTFQTHYLTASVRRTGRALVSFVGDGDLLTVAGR